MTPLPITKEIRWFQLFGENGSEIPEPTRRKRWEEWKALLLAEGHREVVDHWAKDHIEEGCHGCRHKDGDWCKLAGLPVNVNPILTFQFNHIGMACQGAGYNQDLVQGKLF
jgi:hypothetical protein